MADQDYRLEEIENEAVNKSNMAKRAAAAAGLVGAGGVAGYAANHLTNTNNESEQPVEMLTEEDLEGVADSGASQVENEVKPQPQAYTQSQYPSQPKPQEEEAELSFDKTTQYYANDNLVMTEEEGMLDGHKFKLVDIDGDMRADYLAYDEDGNGIYNEDEIIELDPAHKIPMGHEARNIETVRIINPYADLGGLNEDRMDLENEKDLGDNNIHNDFEDEKAGESYSHDYAEDNENYNNNGNVDNYMAGYHSEDTAEEDQDIDNDYDYLAENPSEEEAGEDFDNDNFDII